MGSPAVARENEDMQLVPAAPAFDAYSDPMAEITRRFMRGKLPPATPPFHLSNLLLTVKVLYTFDDENKSNCLTRLPQPLNIPVVFLDETTQLGVIELKSCIQAIVTAR